MVPWMFLTNHGVVFVLVAQHRAITTREIARLTGLTERSVQRMITDLVEGGFVTKRKVGRANHYEVELERALRRPVLQAITVGDLLAGMVGRSNLPDEPHGAPTHQERRRAKRGPNSQAVEMGSQPHRKRSQLSEIRGRHRGLRG